MLVSMAPWTAISWLHWHRRGRQCQMIRSCSIQSWAEKEQGTDAAACRSSQWSIWDSAGWGQRLFPFDHQAQTQHPPNMINSSAINNRSVLMTWKPGSNFWPRRTALTSWSLCAGHDDRRRNECVSHWACCDLAVCRTIEQSIACHFNYWLCWHHWHGQALSLSSVCLWRSELC